MSISLNGDGIVSGVTTFTTAVTGVTTFSSVDVTSATIENISGTNVVISGVTTVSAGSTSVPSISPSGDSNTGVFFPSADTIAFAEGGSEAARIDSSGNLSIANGNLVFSTSGTGIDFSATGEGSGTMTSELLSDYEEGTWTPTFYLGDVLQSYTVDRHNCSYTRIGRVVHLEFWTGWGTYGMDAFPSSDASIFEIGGIPYGASAFYGANMGQARTQGGTSANLGLSILFDVNRISFTSTDGNYSSWYNNGRLGASSISGSALVVIAGSITYKI